MKKAAGKVTEMVPGGEGRVCKVTLVTSESSASLEEAVEMRAVVRLLVTASMGYKVDLYE
jgi:flagellar hook-basal body complex protein FliE